MRYQIERLAEQIKWLVSDENEAFGFDFREHSRLLCLVDDLTEDEQELSNAYIAALEQQQRCYLDLLSEKNDWLKDMTDEQIEKAYITVIKQIRFNDSLQQWEERKAPYEARLIEFGIDPKAVIEAAGLTEALKGTIEDIKRTGKMQKETQEEAE